MRIACLSDAVMPSPTAGGHGLGRVAWTVAEGLRARSHDVTFFARSGSSFSGDLVMPPDADGYGGEVALAREALARHKDWPFDAFIDHGHLHHLASKLPTLPVVNVFHDAYQAYARNAALLSTGQRALMPVEWENAAIVPNALNPSDYVPLFDVTFPAYALFIGAVADIKQPLLAIEACARLGIKLIMAGQQVGGKFPVTDTGNFEYVGVVGGTFKAALYQHARVFLQLGVNESFGLTTLEAGLHGTPVVGWPMGGTLDLVRNGVNGALVVLAGSDKVQNVCDAIERAWDIRRDQCRAVAEALCEPAAQIDRYEALCARVMRGETW